jgi:hypothetical protein
VIHTCTVSTGLIFCYYSVLHFWSFD